MAARKQAAGVEIDGIRIEIDHDYVSSWEGVVQAAEIQRLAKLCDENPDDEGLKSEMMIATIGYYTKVVANIDDLKGVPADKVFAAATEALNSGSSKN